MLLVINMNQYHLDNIYFVDNHKSNDLFNHQFIRLVYTTNLFTLNNIYIHIPFQILHIDKYYNNKYKCTLNIQDNLPIIQFITDLETSILTHPYIIQYCNNKTPLFKLKDQILSGDIKLYDHNDISYYIILKISGIWCTNETYGITYKFLAMNKIN